MLTDTALKNLKPKDAPYKVTDRDGMYATVSTAGTVRSAMTTGSTAGASEVS